MSKMESLLPIKRVLISNFTNYVVLSLIFISLTFFQVNRESGVGCWNVHAGHSCR